MSDLGPMIEMRGITKRFKTKTILADVDLDIFPGHIIGLLGPNGSGKSTLLRHIIGLYLPTRGTCVTFGCKAEKLGIKELSRIGYVHQEGRLPDWMTVEQLIRYVSAYYSNWNKDLEARCVHDFEIRMEDRVRSLSPGQRQKLAILLAIGHEPDLLILDEPASALDHIARVKFLKLLIGIIQQEGRTILIASHILTDVEKVIDHIIMMKDGRIIENQGLDNLSEDFVRVRLSSFEGKLPQKLSFEKALSCHSNNFQAILVLERRYLNLVKDQAETLNCQMDIYSLPLEDVYKIIMRSEY